MQRKDIVMTVLLATVGGLASPTAIAEPTFRGSSGSSLSTVAPPPDEPGKTTYQMANGYIRYRTKDEDDVDDDAEPVSGTEGSFSVMPSEREEPTTREIVVPAPVAATMTPPPAAPAPTPRVAQPDCLKERALLSQRLLQIRGIYVDPASALITLPQTEVPFAPLLTRSLFGTTTPYIGGSLLASAISWDTETQQLTQQLARCLLR